MEPIGNLIRESFKGRVSLAQDKKLFDEQMAYLFIADRHDHLYNDIDGVFTLKNKGIYSICTRYFFSSLVYNCSDNKDPNYNFIKMLNSKFPLPDLTIYIHNPVEISLQRINSRAFKDSYENKEKLIQVQKNYENLFNSDYTKNVIIVNGNDTIENIHNYIVNKVSQFFFLNV